MIAILPSTLPSALPTALPLRAGTLPMAELIDLYMAHYAGRDCTRTQRLGEMPMETVTDDHIHASLELLAADPARRWAGCSTCRWR